MVVPEHTRTNDGARVLGQIRPAIVIDVRALLTVDAPEQRHAPVVGQPRRIPEAEVRRAAQRSVEQQLALRLGSRTLRHKIDDAAHGAGAVQGRGDTFDHLGAPQIERRYLHQTERHLLAEERESVRQEARVPSAHSLNADARGAKRRRCRLHAQSAHLVQQHHNVAGRHHRFFVDLFRVQHLDAHRLVLDAAVGPCRRYRDGFLNRGNLLELDLDRLLLAGGDGDSGCQRRESLFDSDDLDGAWRDRNDSEPSRVGLVGRSADDNVRVAHRAGVRSHLDSDCRGLRGRRSGVQRQ